MSSQQDTSKISREELNTMVNDYLRRGGEIQKLPTGRLTGVMASMTKRGWNFGHQRFADAPFSVTTPKKSVG